MMNNEIIQIVTNDTCAKVLAAICSIIFCTMLFVMSKYKHPIFVFLIVPIVILSLAVPSIVVETYITPFSITRGNDNSGYTYFLYRYENTTHVFSSDKASVFISTNDQFVIKIRSQRNMFNMNLNEKDNICAIPLVDVPNFKGK